MRTCAFARDLSVTLEILALTRAARCSNNARDDKQLPLLAFSDGAEGGNRTHTPLARPRILSPSSRKWVKRAETRVSRIPEAFLLFAVQTFSGSLVAALAQR